MSPSLGRFELPQRVPWDELTGLRKVRRVVGWIAMAGNVGLILSAATSSSDAHIGADGTKSRRPKDDSDSPNEPGTKPA